MKFQWLTRKQQPDVSNPFSKGCIGSAQISSLRTHIQKKRSCILFRQKTNGCFNWLGYDCYMMNHIRHNYPSPIHCLRAFHILFFAYLLFRCYCYNHHKIPKTLLLLSLLLLSYYFATKHFSADTKFLGVVELTTQLLILENILWLPLCRINKFGLNTLPSKTVATPYTCGLSGKAWKAQMEIGLFILGKTASGNL